MNVTRAGFAASYFVSHTYWQLVPQRIIVTTKSKLGSSTIDGNTFLFIPSALYAYWVSKYLFEEKTNQILLPENDA